MDEVDLLDALGKHMRGRSCDKAEVLRVTNDLRYFGKYLGPPRVERALTLAAGVPAQGEAAIVPAGGPAALASLAGVAPLAELEDLIGFDEAEADAGASTDLATSSVEDMPRQGHVTSVSRKGIRRLHRRDRCYWIPGLDYKERRDLGTFAPAATECDMICQARWLDGAGGACQSGQLFARDQ